MDDQTVVKAVPDPVPVEPVGSDEVPCVSEPVGSVDVSEPVVVPEGSLGPVGSVIAELPSGSDGSVSEAVGSVEGLPVLVVGPVSPEVSEGSVLVTVVGVIGWQPITIVSKTNRVNRRMPADHRRIWGLIRGRSDDGSFNRLTSLLFTLG